MKNVKTIKVYNLVDSKGNKLRLDLGVTDSPQDDYLFTSKDKGYRWRFVGYKIPMPVRSMCWFNGFPEDVMLDWLKGNGWYVRTRVDMCSGRANVYELPDESHKGNECFARKEEDETAFCAVVRQLNRDGKMVTATRLYRYANGGDMRDAYHAVMEICSNA